jgi:hypothetical protein
VSVRTEIVRPSVPPALRLPAVRFRAVDLTAGLLGALTTAGLLLLSAVIMVLTLLLAMRRGADALATGLTDASLVTNLLMAVLLGGIVLVSFATGGYVAARLSTAGGRAQGVVVWGWAMVIPVLGTVVAAAGDGAAAQVLDAITDDGAVVILTLSAIVGGLLGALLGADAAGRNRAGAVPMP